MTITREQARQRFITIPLRLQDAIFSVQTAEIMDGIAQQYHLDDPKVKTIGKITGWVLLGFAHPEDVAREIQEQLAIPAQVASEISGSINAKIFNSLRDELDKVYAPALLPQEEAALGPKIIQESKAPSPAPQAPQPPKPAAPKPQVISQSAMGFGVSASPLASNKNAAAPAPQPGKSGDQGWSKQTPQDPVVKLGVITSNTQPPAAAGAASAKASPVAPPLQQPPMPQPTKGMSEFDRLDMMKKSTPQPPTKPQEPAPMILHQATPTTSPLPSPGFRINNPVQNQISDTDAGKPLTSKPAVLELGNAPKVVHYSEYKTTIPPAMTPPPAATGPRHITEITPQPAQPQQPTPAAPPKPPQPPSPNR